MKICITRKRPIANWETIFITFTNTFFEIMIFVIDEKSPISLKRSNYNLLK